MPVKMIYIIEASDLRVIKAMGRQNIARKIRLAKIPPVKCEASVIPNAFSNAAGKLGKLTFSDSSIAYVRGRQVRNAREKANKAKATDLNLNGFVSNLPQFTFSECYI